jgi:GH35 family endo-1,4-beta-xylanase
MKEAKNAMSEAPAPRTDRRKFLKYLGIAAAGAAVGAAVERYAWIPTPSSNVTVANTATLTQAQTVTEKATETVVYPASLRAAAEARGLLIGSEAGEAGLKDKRFGPTLAREFSSLTASMTWGQTDRYRAADALVKFASEHQMKVGGRTLNLARESTCMGEFANFRKRTSTEDAEPHP